MLCLGMLIMSCIVCSCGKKETVEDKSSEAELELNVEKNEFSIYDGDNADKIIEDAKKEEIRIYDEYLDYSSEGGITAYVDKLKKIESDNEYVNQVEKSLESIGYNEQSYLSQDILQLFLDLRFGQLGRFIDELIIKGASIAGYEEPTPSGSRLIVLDVSYAREGYGTESASITHTVLNGEEHMTYIFNNKGAHEGFIEKFLGIPQIGEEGVCSFGGDKSAASEDNHWLPFDGVSYFAISKEELKEQLYNNIPFIEVMNLYREKVFMPSYREEYLDKKEKNESENAEPAIGMTKSEVITGAWGEPDKKNIDEYEWGTEEQWVYDGKGYVYFEDGIVTAIQHRE